MKNRNYSRAKILILIPIIVFVLIVISMVFATKLEIPTGKGTVYSIFAFFGILSMFLSPLPCLVISIIGTIFAAKAIKEGIIQSRKYLVIGIIEIFTYVLGVILAIAMFIGGQGV